MTSTMELMLSIFYCTTALAIIFGHFGAGICDDKWKYIMNKASITFMIIMGCSIIGIILTLICGW